MKGFDVLLTIANEPVAAQIDATLQRGATTSDISNMITLDWQDYLIHNKYWRVNCNGAYVVNDKAMDSLEKAFAAGASIQVELSSPTVSFKGEGVLIDFPIGADFNKDTTYRLTIQGKGALTREVPDEPREVGYCLEV